MRESSGSFFIQGFKLLNDSEQHKEMTDLSYINWRASVASETLTWYAGSVWHI